jgi:hypothetical protein
LLTSDQSYVTISGSQGYSRVWSAIAAAESQLLGQIPTLFWMVFGQENNGIILGLDDHVSQWFFTCLKGINKAPSVCFSKSSARTKDKVHQNEDITCFGVQFLTHIWV